jgi:phosphate transport system substrate-binding protein
MRSLAVLLIGGTIACAGAGRPVIRVTGSDTMVNLVQAWAEDYGALRPDVSVQVAGGGSGVGIAALIDGTADIAAASREMRAEECRRAADRLGRAPREFAVALDAIAVYVQRGNPLPAIALDQLAEIYGEDGRIVRWSQLGVHPRDCPSGAIIRVGRQNSSGTYASFRDLVLGTRREYAMGSIDQSGSKDVVALVEATPCAIGYSGIAYATAGVRALGLSARAGAPAVAPGARAVADGSYPLARRVYLSAAPDPPAHVAAFIEWTLGADGQRTVSALGFVPVPAWE